MGARRSKSWTGRERWGRVLAVLPLVATLLVFLGAPEPVDAAPGAVTEEASSEGSGLDAPAGTATIEGTVYDIGATPLEDVLVQAFEPGQSISSFSDVSDVNGTYSITGVDAGDWLIRFTGPPTEQYVDQYYDQAYATATASQVTVTDGQTVTDIDGHLGQTCYPMGPPPPLAPGCFVTSMLTCFWGVPGVTYGEWTFWWDELSCGGDPDTVHWTTNHGDDVVGNGVTLTFPPGQWSVVTGCLPGDVLCDEASFPTQGNAIEGTVRDLDGTPVPNVFVTAYDPGTLSAGGSAITDASGNYALGALPGDEWLVHVAPDPVTDYVFQWYDQAYSTTTATPVTLGPSTVTGIDAHLGATCAPLQSEDCYLMSEGTCFVGVPGTAYGEWTFWWDELSCPGDGEAVNWINSNRPIPSDVGNGVSMVFPAGTSTVDACVPVGGSAYCDTLTFELAPTAAGYLRVTTNPAVPATISVDGEYRNAWGLDWVSVPVGDHEVCFSDVAGFVTPPCEVVEVFDGATTTVQGDYEALGQLKVEVSPAGLPSTVFVDGNPVNDFGAFLWSAPGDHEVCWGDVDGYTAPACVTADVTAGGLTTEVGTFTPGGDGSPGPAPDLGTFGYLRATTNPPVGATIVVDGIPRNAWGLDWMKISVGPHEVCFTQVVGFFLGVTCSFVEVTEGATSVVEGSYLELGILQVQVDPAGLPVDVLVDGLPVNKFGVLAWSLGPHRVCFTDLDGFTTPACQDVGVSPGATTVVVGQYT